MHSRLTAVPAVTKSEGLTSDFTLYNVSPFMLKQNEGLSKDDRDELCTRPQLYF